jgi:deazaflavin-dependent oxidoreductase (nitroreductase family)
MIDRGAVSAELARGGVIDITTSGRRTGQPRRIEIVFFPIDGGIYISGMPGRRAWLANLTADPRLTFHLKRRVKADLPATGRIVTDPDERRRLLEHITAAWGRQAQLQTFVERAPLIEVRFDDPALTAASEGDRASA